MTNATPLHLLGPILGLLVASLACPTAVAADRGYLTPALPKAQAGDESFTQRHASALLQALRSVTPQDDCYDWFASQDDQLAPIARAGSDTRNHRIQGGNNFASGTGHRAQGPA